MESSKLINIKENNLIELGFKKEDVSAIESGGNSYHYFVFEINEKTILISNASDETKNGCYSIQFFEYPEIIEFTSYYVLNNLVEIIKSGIVKDGR